MQRAVIIDTDPGIDDAVAILLALASPEFDVLAVTTVAGNLGIDTTTRNAGRILALTGRGDIPVHPGAADPLSGRAPDSADVHGGDGVGGVALPEPAVPPSATSAVEFMAEALSRRPAGTIDIFALGPLTNIALLLRHHPMAAGRIGRLIAMGGAIDEPGNVGPGSEFNFAVDPEAAAEVLAAGLDLTIVPLDVTRKVRATRPMTAALLASTSRTARTCGALIDAYFQTTTGGGSRPLHDPCVMLLALRTDLFGVERLAIAVDLDDDRGALVAASSGAAKTRVAMTVDAASALDLLWERLLKG